MATMDGKEVDVSMEEDNSDVEIEGEILKNNRSLEGEERESGRSSFECYGPVNLGYVLYSYQMAGVSEAMRIPFGIDDGSKFGSKASMKLELSDGQLAFVRAVEDKVIATATKNKADWFPGVKPLPSDDDVRKAFSSRVSVDPEGQYKASLRVNCNLADDAKKLKVSTTRRLGDGKIEPPKRGSAEDVQWGDYAVPVLQTAGGVWVKKTKKLTDSCFGLIFEASEVLIIKGADEDGAGSFNLGGVEVAEPEQEAHEACGGEGGFGGQFH